ncbi:MAG: hypothetical protein AB1644_07220 [Candidatus Zixiibacteriota bacterium]
MMEISDHTAYIAELREALTEDRLSYIDFDQLRSWLEQLGPVLDRIMASDEELRLLRQDYQGRIAGMLKAIAAADRKQSGLQSVLREAETLADLTSAQLIECYRRTSARFRDCFPTSFGLLIASATPTGREKRYAEYK